MEGDTDVPIARRLLQLAGLEVGPVHGLTGKAALDRQLRGYNNAAAYAPWLVLRDMNGDAPCAAQLVRTLLPQGSRGMCFRIAVRAAEAWLLADRERVSHSLGVAASKIPVDPDSLPDPKGTLVSLSRRSRSRRIREAMVPAVGTTARVGPGYTSWVIEFASGDWRPSVAATRSRSLASCIEAVKRLQP